jgi:macrolide phosphotransferase
VCTLGELYPAHVLIDDEDRPSAVLDWTTAKVSDPGRDFAAQHMTAGPEAFAITVDTYEHAGWPAPGRAWPTTASSWPAPAPSGMQCSRW